MTKLLSKEICFNGRAPNNHETFWLPEKLMDLETQYPHEIAEILGHKENVVFNFCKTNQKPYDIVVTQCLVILKHFLQEDADVSGDGEREGFEEAVEIVNKKYRTNQFKEDLNVQEFKNPYDYKKED